MGRAFSFDALPIVKVSQSVTDATASALARTLTQLAELVTAANLDRSGSHRKGLAAWTLIARARA
jgi:hypothetical protein